MAEADTGAVKAAHAFTGSAPKVTGKPPCPIPAQPTSVARIVVNPKGKTRLNVERSMFVSLLLSISLSAKPRWRFWVCIQQDWQKAQTKKAVKSGAFMQSA
jgi:hypothetical protein